MENTVLTLIAFGIIFFVPVAWWLWWSGVIGFQVALISSGAAIIAGGLFAKAAEDSMTPEQREADRQRMLKQLEPQLNPERREALQAATREQIKQEIALSTLHGDINPDVICPHCQSKGYVRMKGERIKAGISGAKATGAILTGGVSLLATGLSRKQNVTAAHCGKCNVRWNI